MYRFAVEICQPLTVVWLVLAVAIVLIWRAGRVSRRRWLLLVFAFAGLTAAGSKPLAHLALRSLEGQYPPADITKLDVGAIVVLSGGIQLPNDQRPYAVATDDTMRRCLHASRLYHAGPPRPMVLCGGKVDPSRPGPTLSRVMADLMLRLGVRPADLIIEEHSASTYENARMTRTLLVERKIDRIALVTDAVHLPRSVGCFSRQGFDVVPAGCHYTDSMSWWSVSTFLPQANAMRDIHRVTHEWLGMLWYSWHGRM